MINFEPTFLYSFVDPEFVKNGSAREKALYDIHSFPCTALDFQIVPALGSNIYTVSAANITDENEALNYADDCRSEYSKFRDYESSVTNIAPLDSSICDVASPFWDGNTSCISNNLINMKSLFSDRKSQRGTNAKTIILDESAIAGGVMFFTWFLGLYVL